MAGVHGFKGSGVQGSILIPGLHLGCVFTIKASVLSLTLNVEPWTCERLHLILPSYMGSGGMPFQKKACWSCTGIVMWSIIFCWRKRLNRSKPYRHFN